MRFSLLREEVKGKIPPEGLKAPWWNCILITNDQVTLIRSNCSSVECCLMLGKGHNHDCCDACGEGGDLICCDGCPASFHLTCHAPPLDEEDLPIKGDWLCLKCHYKQVSRNGTIQITQKMDALSTCTTPTETSSETTQPEKLTPAEIIEPAVPTCSRPTRSRRAAAASASSAVQVSTPNNALNNKVSQKKIQENKQMKIYRNKYNAYLAVKPKTNSPFDALIAAVQVNTLISISIFHVIN